MKALIKYGLFSVAKDLSMSNLEGDRPDWPSSTDVFLVRRTRKVISRQVDNGKIAIRMQTGSDSLECSINVQVKIN